LEILKSATIVLGFATFLCRSQKSCNCDVAVKAAIRYIAHLITGLTRTEEEVTNLLQDLWDLPCFTRGENV